MTSDCVPFGLRYLKVKNYSEETDMHRPCRINRHAYASVVWNWHALLTNQNSFCYALIHCFGHRWIQNLPFPTSHGSLNVWKLARLRRKIFQRALFFQLMVSGVIKLPKPQKEIDSWKCSLVLCRYDHRTVKANHIDFILQHADLGKGILYFHIFESHCLLPSKSKFILRNV